MRLQSYSLTRIWFLLGIKTVLLLLLVGRLTQLAIIDNPEYSVLAKGNRIHSRILPAQRGRILDHKGHVLAETEQTYFGYVFSDTKQDLRKRLDQITRIIERPVHLQNDFAQRRILPLKENLSWEEMAKLETHKIPGVFITPSSRRFYPVPEAFSHVLGYVSPPTEKDDPSLQHPFLCVGHGGGIEQVYDETLRGTMGFVEEEMDSKRHLVRILGTTPPEEGQDLVTTLDKNLQEFTYQLLQDEGIKSAGVVVLDTQNGAIKTLVSQPSYDTNDFVQGIATPVWKNLMCNPYRPLFNKVVQGQYAPGSVFKIVMALAGLRSGVITEKTTAFCPGYIDCGGRRFHCWAWNKGGHGHVDFYKAMAGSCDVFFYQMAKKMKIQDVLRAATDLGLGSKTGLDLLYEKTGLLPKPTWFKRKQFGEMLNLSIGQGRLLTTPLQLAVMMATVVNGGKRITPHIDSKTCAPIVNQIKDVAHLSILHQALIGVINAKEGTGYGFRFETPDRKPGFGGKTGTTQVSAISMKDRATGRINNKAEFLRDHSLFVGFAPAENPRFVVAVILENGGWGANAGRIGQQIVKKLT
ncbi:MAG: penicillin-binding protein 2 [Pseudomonadota bacterium]